MLTGLWPFVLVCMGLVIVWNVTNYMLTSYMPTYVTYTCPRCRAAVGLLHRRRSACRSG